MIAIALGNLAQAEIKLRERAAARRDAQEALPLAQKLGAIPLVLFAVQVFAEILVAEGNTSRALALLGLVRSHPSTYYEQHQEIDTVLAGLDLDAADLEAGLAAGASLDLDTVVAEILAF
jgi:hypothetical protein